MGKHPLPVRRTHNGPEFSSVEPPIRLRRQADHKRRCPGEWRTGNGSSYVPPPHRPDTPCNPRQASTQSPKALQLLLRTTYVSSPIRLVTILLVPHAGHPLGRSHQIAQGLPGRRNTCVLSGRAGDRRRVRQPRTVVRYLSIQAKLQLQCIRYHRCSLA